jgi:hypothetical protein
MKNFLDEQTLMTTRKAKRNWVEGKKIVTIGLQTQASHVPTFKSKKNQQAEVSESGTLVNLVIEAVKQVDATDNFALLKAVVDKTRAVVRDRGAHISLLEPFLTALIKKSKKGDLDELIRYSNLLSKLQDNNDHTLNLWIKIFTALGDDSEPLSLKKMLEIQAGLENHSTLLNAIAELFDYPPYPVLEQFIIELGKNRKDLKTYIESFDKDPKDARAPQFNPRKTLTKSKQHILNEQFDTVEVRQVVTNIQSMVDGSDLTRKQRYELAQKMIYINAIGYEHPFVVEGKVHTNLTEMSRSGLRELSDALIAHLRNPVLGEQDRLKAQLNLLAIMRELYFRTTGKFIYNNQMLLVLMSLTDPQHNMLLELDNEEEKDVATALLAAMQWVMADGGTIDVCTTNRRKLVQQYTDQGISNFFTSLGIPSAAVFANDPAGVYKVGGINYSTISDLVLYNSRVQPEDDDLVAKKIGHHLSRNLIINGVNFSTLDDRAHFNFSSEVEGNDSDSNSYAWIYPLINGFINQNEFQRLATLGTDAWNEEQDLAQLKIYLDTHASTPVHKQQLKDFSDKKLTTWINSACVVKQLVENEHFEIKKTSTSAHAVPLFQGELQEGFIFDKGRQQFLHAQLQIKYPSEHFTIEPEMESEDSVTVKDLINIYKERGHIVGIFDQIGTKDDLVYQRSRLGIDVAYQLSPHKKNLYRQLDPMDAAELDKKKSIEGIDKIQRKKNQELNVQSYYLRTVSIIQHTVLKQFGEWAAFLHLVYPKSEWKKLDRELLVQREELIASLEEHWTQCLEDSDPKKSHQNPYIRRHPRTNKLQTAELDQALKNYEGFANTIWTTNRGVLKVKTAGKIKVGSVNALRCTYLQKLDFNEQLQLNKLAQQQNRTDQNKEKQKTNRYLDTRLDVNGAMLTYSDVPNREYKLAFAKSQLKVLVNDLGEEIKRSSLSASTQALFMERVESIENFLELELALKDYHRWISPSNFEEKYRLQPIINELVRVYKYLELQESEELQVLKQIYLDDVAIEIVTHLENSLSWAVEKNRGLEYWIERTAVQNAAKGILKAVAEVKSAIDTPTRQRAIKNLYKVLTQHQAQLEGLWIFSFGHTNTRDLINKTLSTLDDLTAIGSGRDQLNAAFIKECKESANSDLMKEQFNVVLRGIEDKYGKSLTTNPEWDAIKEQLNSIQTANDTVYVADELYYLLSKTSKQLNQLNSPLFKPVIALRGELRSIWNKFYHNHKDLVSQSGFFDSKAESLQKVLKGLTGFRLKNVTIKPVHTGFGDSFDLIVEGRGSNPLFDTFSQFNAQILFLDKERATLVAQQEHYKTQISMAHKVQNEQIPLLKEFGVNSISLDLFPEDYRVRVNEIVTLKGWVSGKLPDDLSVYSKQDQIHFHDGNLVKTFELTQLTLDQINKIKDGELKASFTGLFNKINGQKQNQTWLSRIWDFATPSFGQENSDDWRYQFAELQARPDSHLRTTLQTSVNKKIESLAADLINLETEAVSHIQSLVEQIEFVDEKRAEQINTGNVIVKRFENLDEFYEFENNLRAVTAAQPQSATQPVVQYRNLAAAQDESEEVRAIRVQ